MSSWIHYVPMDGDAYYVKGASLTDEHGQKKSCWELPSKVNPENVLEVRIAGDWSVEFADCCHI